MTDFKVGQLVRLTDKGVKGTIAFYGETKFGKDKVAKDKFTRDKWIGIILEEAKGKNNGTIDGVTYFKCPGK